MDYEKKYKNAFTIAQSRFKIEKDESVLTCLGMMFPELRESEDEMIRKGIIEIIKAVSGPDCDVYLDEKKQEKYLAWLEKQKEITMPNSTELIEMWHKAKATLKEKDFRGDEWRLAQNAFMDGFARGTCVKFEKQKDQKPAEKQDYSGLNDLERAIHRGFISAGVENVSITIIKETARECLAQMNPEEWNDTDMKEARDSLISVCRDWERGQKTTLLPIAAVRARYFLEHLTEPKHAEWSEEDETHLGWIIECFDSWKYQVPEFADQYQSAINWLKSLCHQPKQEWSKEDEKIMQTMIKEGDLKPSEIAWLKSLRPQPKQEWSEENERIREALYKHFSVLYPGDSKFRDTKLSNRQITDFLKSLRPSWKPSEEQMDAFRSYIKDFQDKAEAAVGGWNNFDVMIRLYEQLKKLM